MSYRKLGIVGKHYDDHKNLLKRQLAATDYIRLFKSGRDIIIVDVIIEQEAGCAKGSEFLHLMHFAFLRYQ